MLLLLAMAGPGAGIEALGAAEGVLFVIAGLAMSGGDWGGVLPVSASLGTCAGGGVVCRRSLFADRGGEGGAMGGSRGTDASRRLGSA